MIIINESGEELVDLKKFCPDFVIDLEKKRLAKEKTAYLRKGVAEMLKKAQSFLPKGVSFIIGDAWRPREIQEKILKRFARRFSREHSKWSKERVKQEVEIFAAPAKGKEVSGHMTGGAVDLRLWKAGRKLPMKSKKLSYQENSQSYQPKLPKYIKRTRKIMFDVLKKAGLSNVPTEYWHWSYGDIWWAKRNHKNQAIYGPVDFPNS